MGIDMEGLRVLRATGQSTGRQLKLGRPVQAPWLRQVLDCLHTSWEGDKGGESGQCRDGQAEHMGRVWG